MGYDLHITRAANWAESENLPITLKEWIAYVQDDPEMRLEGFAEATTPKGETVRYENEGLAVWHLPQKKKDQMGWFDYRRGKIVVKNPDDATIIKMKQIATALNARVLGDEGELY